MNNGHGTAARLRGAVHHIDLTVRDVAASAPFYEALLGFLGYVRVKQEVALHVLGPEPGRPGRRRVALRAAQSERRHDRYSAGLHHLAFLTPPTAPMSTAPMRS